MKKLIETIKWRLRYLAGSKEVTVKLEWKLPIPDDEPDTVLAIDENGNYYWAHPDDFR